MHKNKVIYIDHVTLLEFIDYTECLDIFVDCNWANTRWQWYSTHDQYIG